MTGIFCLSKLPESDKKRYLSGSEPCNAYS